MQVCSSERDLQTHAKTEHNDDRPYKCTKCDATFIWFWNLGNHQRRLHDTTRPSVGKILGGYKRRENQQHKCLDCDFIGRSERLLRLHCREQHNNPKPYKCAHCAWRFTWNWDRRKHEQRMHDPNRVQRPQRFNLACRKCDERFTNEIQLRQHFARAHGGLRPLQCAHCDATFAHNYRKKQHEQQAHDILPKDDSLPMLPAAVGSIASVDAAVADSSHAPHSDTGGVASATDAALPSRIAFHCAQCKQMFNVEIMYTQHCRTEHGVTRPFTCTVCAVDFANSWSRLRHERIVHKQPASQTINVTCRLCSLTVAGEEMLRKHFLHMHGSNRPFKCVVCEADFQVRAGNNVAAPTGCRTIGVGYVMSDQCTPMNARGDLSRLPTSAECVISVSLVSHHCANTSPTTTVDIGRSSVCTAP
jgi:hypothetical protein